MATVRQSTMGSFGKCSWQLKHVLSGDYGYRSGAARALGTAIHAGLETYYIERKEGLPPAGIPGYIEATVASLDAEVERSEIFNWTFQNQTQRKDELILDRESSIEMLSELITLYHENKWFYPLDYEVLEVEMSFNLPLPSGKHIAHGTCDLLLRDPRGRLIAGDHKTSKEFPTKSRWGPNDSPQAPYYTWAINQITGTPIEEIGFYYDVLSWAPQRPGRGNPVDPNARFARFEETCTIQQVESVIGQAEIVGDLLEKESFHPNTNGWWCSKNFCDFWNECQFAKDKVL
tara:strand:- start:225 stop:1091 length:867 start_codon:yes stop_codon:yes gene_type:complete